MSRSFVKKKKRNNKRWANKIEKKSGPRSQPVERNAGYVSGPLGERTASSPPPPHQSIHIRGKSEFASHIAAAAAASFVFSSCPADPQNQSRHPRRPNQTPPPGPPTQSPRSPPIQSLTRPRFYSNRGEVPRLGFPDSTWIRI